MKHIFISLFLVTTTCCSHNAPDADNPSVGPVQPNSEDDVQFRTPSSDPVSPNGSAVGGSQPSTNELASVRARQDARPLGPVPTAPSASTSASFALPTLGAAPNSPDNTGINQRDQKANTLTPIDQSNSQPDLNITQAVRKAIMANDGMSFNAKNIKIITIGGKVTLRGPVNSVTERQNITAIAKQTAGVVNVDDQLEVKP